jgi:hypothetical protein
VKRARVPIARVAVLALSLSLPSAAPALAQCSYPTLISGTVVSLGSGATPQFTSNANYWTAVGSRGPAGDDWDLSVNSSTGEPSLCVSGTLASSTYSAGVDFVVGDFNANPHGTYYARSYRFGGTGTAADVEWDHGFDQLLPNAMPAQRSTGPDDVLECWDTYLEAGVTYTLNLVSFGTATTRAFLFRNTTGGAYWVGRTYRVLEVAMNTPGTYVAPASGWYGIVVTNEDGGSSSYSIGIGNCAAPGALTSGSPSYVTGAHSWTYFDQATNYYTAVAVRSNDPAQDWDIGVYGAASGGAYPVCFGSPLAAEAFGSQYADVIIGDFNGGANPTGRYYVHTYPYGATTSDARVEWDDGPNQLGVDQPSVYRTTGPGDIIECWDVYLTDGQWYTFNFAHDGAADLKLLVVRNPGAGFWVNRASPSVTTFTSSEQYIAQSTDWYSVVVVNDNGGEGTYRLGVTTCPQEAYSLGPNNTVYSQSDWKYAMQIHPDSLRWMAFGTRSRDAGQDWDLQLFSDFSGGTLSSGCASNQIAGSAFGPGRTDFVIGDMHVNPLGFVFPLPYAFGATTADGFMMWDEADPMQVGDPPVVRTINHEFLLGVHEVYLTASSPYSIRFNRSGAADLRYCVIDNPSGGQFWGSRSSAVLQDATGTLGFTPTTTGWHAIVVTSEFEATGEYDLQVVPVLIGVDDPPAPGANRLVGIAPNPARAATRIAFELATPGPVTFDIVNLAGRRVATLSLPAGAAGRGNFEWDGRDTEGRTVGSGVYFVSMIHGGRAVGRSQLVVLR